MFSLTKELARPLRSTAMSEATLFPHSLAPCVVYSQLLIKVLMPFMMMRGLQLITTATT